MKNFYQTRFYGDRTKWRKALSRIKELGADKALKLVNEEYTPIERISRTETKENLSLKVDDTEIKTEEELIKACNVDLDKWELIEFSTSAWGQNSKKEGFKQLYSVKGKFKKREQHTFEVWLKRIKEGLYNYQAPEFIPVVADSDFCSIINLYDAHLDKVTRFAETEEETDIYNNCALFNSAFDYLLSNVGDTSLIIIPIGNDLFNVNDGSNATKKGTPQATYLHHADTFEIILDLIRGVIEKAAKIAPIYIPMIPGNHDEDMIHILGVVLNSIYKKSDSIQIDYSRCWRKYKQWGDNMFMFAHGNHMKSKVSQIPHIIAQERKTMWANTVYRYAFFGDIHHKNEYQFQRGKDFIGVNVKFLRAISAGDVWHHKKGYIGVEKTAELYNVSKCGRFFNEVKYSF